MSCPDCGGETLSFRVPDAHRELLPGSDPGASLCSRCLALRPASDPPADPPDLTPISDAFPSNPEAAVPLALLVGLLDSLARYRSEISTLLVAVERAGSDPLLAIDRLADDPDIDTDVDLRKRRHQLEQLL